MKKIIFANLLTSIVIIAQAKQTSHSLSNTTINIDNSTSVLCNNIIEFENTVNGREAVYNFDNTAYFRKVFRNSNMADTTEKIHISFPDMANFKYLAGKQYTIVVTFTNSGAKRYGIYFGAFNNAREKAGILKPAADLQDLKGEITNTNSPSSNTFQFKWVAPELAPTEGNITFYVAGFVTNYDGTQTGGKQYLSEQIITLDNSDTAQKSNK